jgi:hypothetical protein
MSMLRYDRVAFDYEPYLIGLISDVFELGVYQRLCESYPDKFLFQHMPPSREQIFAISDEQPISVPLMLLCGEENLRQVVLFLMNQQVEDLLMGVPSEVSPKQLRKLHIRFVLPEKK